MDLALYIILVPMIAGAVVRIIPDALKGVKEGITLAAAAATLWFAIVLFRMGWLESKLFGITMFRVDTLSGFILLWVGIFGLVMMLYSVGFMRGSRDLKTYYAYSLLSLGAAMGAVLANDMILLLGMWGFLAMTLYMLINTAGPKAAGVAKKTMIIIGGTDSILVLGVVVLWMMTGSTSLSQEPIPTITGVSVLAFILFVCAAFAKAGAMPFHSWIPDAAEAAPTSTVAFLPASLDKLLGIYLLARVCLNVFNPTPAMVLILMIVGAVTLIAGVLMALVQHDMKRLLGYHAVSQVGYMVIGIATLNPIGIAGGLFHMLNNAIYKGCLFLTAGAVEKREGTTDLDALGGLAKYMPVTFAACVLASLAISGVPPFNGFVSKWMVYQGIIEMGKQGGHLWVVWLLAAMFGSALTLASFVKVLHSVFLGVREKGRGPKEVSFVMWLPMLGLGILCLVFGVFAFALPLKIFILPAVSALPAFKVLPVASWLGWWSPGLATILIAAGIVIGLLIYLAGRVRPARVDSSYVGGEILPGDTRVTGTGFYNTVSDMTLFRGMYKWAGMRAFDIYDIGKAISFYFIRGLRALHSGNLPDYVTWALAGWLIIMAIFVR
jgi:formate hydrogenlyase subunit 3/multisubunit Na+/H+ antiporter MnhD subunit